MSRVYNRNEVTDEFKKLADNLGIDFYIYFDIDYMKYKGLFVDPNRNGDDVVRFDVYQDELTEEVIFNIMDSVRDAFAKEDK